MRRMKQQRDRLARRGAAMVEMALVLPLFILLIFGVMEYGWLFWKASQVNNAAREGARTAVRPDATSAEVDAAISRVMAQSGLAGKYQVPTYTLSVPVGQPVKIIVKLDYRSASLVSHGFIPVPDELVSAVSMAKEGP
jgi:Flp pilus assembly protein TadG